MTVSVKRLSKSYRQGSKQIEILKSLDLELATGEIVGVVGVSGSGKSTLLGILAGLDQPNAGEILVNGFDLTKSEENARTSFRAKSISVVFQQFHLIPHLTAEENVSLPLEILGKPDPSKVKALMQDVGLADRLDHLPSQLSGGECQRVAIARALVIEPALLLADEPNGSLDVETAKTVMDLFFALVKKHHATCILVTHNSELAARCDRVLHLVGGRF